ncbi:MAG: isoprenylcysteine carboxylmethyltransferase family protein [Chloroflexi bacterium]|nr:isoprenylcysteine carboxylmethyltransferase family protein [Chloroflexota bacterium]
MLWDWAMSMLLLLTSIPLSWWMFQSRKMPHRSGQVLLFAIYTPVLVGTPFLEQPTSEEPTLPGVGTLLIALGCIIATLALLEFQHHQVPLLPETWAPPRIVQTGIYRFIRHPMSTAQITLCIGWFCVWKAPLALLLIAPMFILVVWLRARWEESYILLPRFGKAYRDYQGRTGMLLPVIPNMTARNAA